MLRLNTSLRLVRVGLFSAGSAFCLLALPVSSLHAADSATTAASADSATTLPLTASFAKDGGSEGAPYTLTLKNDSSAAVTATAKVLLNVASHAESKARQVPEHVIDAGQTWTIPGLAAGDKVVVSAKGFAPLKLTVQ